MLPLELIDHIFSFLRGNIPALKACSKTHPFLSQLVDRHLYADIVVGTEDNSSLAVSELLGLLSKNSCILYYPRALEIRVDDRCTYPTFWMQDVQSILSMVPRMANLKSLTLCEGRYGSIQYIAEGFLSTFRNCLQQSSVEQVTLVNFYRFPLSVLDNGRNIKVLILSECISMRGRPESPLQFPETLIMRGCTGSELIVWAASRATNLKSLQLRGQRRLDLHEFPGLLAACSNSLTTFHLDAGEDFQSTYLQSINHQVRSFWKNDYCTFPFTLSAHRCLKQISVSTLGLIFLEPMYLVSHCALPAIMRLIKSAPAIQDVALRFHWKDVTGNSLGRLDWSPFVLLQPDFPGVGPRTHLCISGESEGRSISPETILDTLAANENLMDLVKQGMVTFEAVYKSKASWEEWTGFS